MDIGVQLDGLVEIALSTHIVVELQLAESAIIPRLIQVRFGREHMVEMLDSHHIVLVVVSYLAGNNQPIGTELGVSANRTAHANEDRQKKEHKETPAPKAKHR